MEETSNGKLEEFQKVETHDGDKEVVVEDSGEFKTEAESVKQNIVINGNSEFVIENHDGDDLSSHSSRLDEEVEPNEYSTVNEGSGEAKEEKTVGDSVVDSVELEVSSPSEEFAAGIEAPDEKLEASDDVAESKSKETEDNLSQSLDETNEVSADTTNEDSNVIKEAILPSSDENDNSNPAVPEIVSKAIEETKLPSSEEKGIQEIPLPSSDESCVVPLASTEEVSMAIEETKFPGLDQNPDESSGTAKLQSKEKVNESSQEAANIGTVDTKNVHEYTDKPEIPASTGNPPITSLPPQTRRPTSWRSCCGLLEVLRRSDR